MAFRPCFCVCLIVGLGCAPPAKPIDEHEMGDPMDPPPGDPVDDAAVYAHSNTDLYKVDPNTLEVTHVAAFVWPSDLGIDDMTDIALDKDVNMVGISFGSVYAVNKETGVCTFLSSLDRSFNGLSFIPAGGVDASTEEVLVAASDDGSVYRLHPMTGMATPIGAY